MPSITPAQILALIPLILQTIPEIYDIYEDAKSGNSTAADVAALLQTLESVLQQFAVSKAAKK